MSQRILFLGVYGMEMIECGGALAINAQQGGGSYASIMLASGIMRDELKNSAKELGLSKVYFNNFQSGNINLSKESKLELIKVIRSVRPDIIITQDPEHSFEDLDPDRRPAMLLLFEAIALAGRSYGLTELPDLEPFSVPTIYYMNPKLPNCCLSISSVLEVKERAMDCLSTQMRFSGKYFSERLDTQEQLAIHSEFNILTVEQKGREVQRAMDRALYLHTGLLSHGRFALAEPYRRKGLIELECLIK
ncbi:PIG-L deacetylase family protein [Vibrio harveyi]